MRTIDLTGQRFGWLTVIERTGSIRGHSVWLCRCDCGKETVATSDNLKSGHVQSCGCLKRDTTRKIRTELNTIHGGRKTRLYRIWDGMKARCTRPSHKSYKNYGSRGITICAEWLNDFGAFQKWALAHGYQDDLTIDRIDNDKGYSPDNCRWVTMADQSRNKRPKPNK